MFKSTLTTSCLAAVAGAAMLTLSMTPASAFTLASPSLAQPVANSQIEHIWWDRWGNWHPGPRWGWGFAGPGWGPGYGYYGYGNGRRCWRGYYGRLHCSW